MTKKNDKNIFQINPYVLQVRLIHEKRKINKTCVNKSIHIRAQTSTLPGKQKKSVENASDTTYSVLQFIMIIYRGLILLTTCSTQSMGLFWAISGTKKLNRSFRRRRYIKWTFSGSAGAPPPPSSPAIPGQRLSRHRPVVLPTFTSLCPSTPSSFSSLLCRCLAHTWPLSSPLRYHHGHGRLDLCWPSTSASPAARTLMSPSRLSSKPAGVEEDR